MELIQKANDVLAMADRHIVEEKAEQSMLKVKLDVKYIDSLFLNNRYCHSHWHVEDVTTGSEISHAAWFYEIETNTIVILGAIPNHTYRIRYNDVLFS